MSAPACRRLSTNAATGPLPAPLNSLTSPRTRSSTTCWSLPSDAVTEL